VLAVQVRTTCALPAAPCRPVGADGAVAGAVGVAFISFELALSPVEFTADTS